MLVKQYGTSASRPLLGSLGLCSRAKERAVTGGPGPGGSSETSLASLPCLMRTVVGVAGSVLGRKPRQQGAHVRAVRAESGRPVQPGHHAPVHSQRDARRPRPLCLLLTDVQVGGGGDEMPVQTFVVEHVFGVNKNNSSTTFCSQFLAFLKPFSVNCDWRMLSVCLFRA